MSHREILDLAIVTSVHNYGQYLEDWAQSIVSQMTHLPKICTIVDNGSTDNSPRQIKRAEAILKSAGISVRTQRMPFANFGAARNRAVEISGHTEWVMHLDADDMLMPYCLTDAVDLMSRADVIGFGYQRSGDLASGPSNRTRLYSTHQGEKTLKSTAPCSGVSPFRRSFWEKSPYRTDMRGGWDTALWIGFAHLNARFVPTKRPVFYYRQHADSIFNTRRLSERKGRLVGTKLNNLRKKIADGVSIIVPIMGDAGQRDSSWRWVRQRYEKLHPDWEVIEGCIPRGSSWRKGQAVARAVEESINHTLVVVDSDCFISPDALERAVQLLREEDVGWVVPHDLVHRIDYETTSRVIGESVIENPFQDMPLSYQRKPYQGYAGGGMFVVDRSDYEAVGGIPQIFEGWGAEDECLAVIMDTILEPHARLSYDLWHLYHQSARRKNSHHNRTNRTLLRIFLEYAGRPDAMWGLVNHVAEGGDPRSYSNGQAGTFLMRAVETHQRGKKTIKAGDYFRVTDEEVRRYQARSRKIAYPVNSSLLETVSHQKRRL